LLAILLVITFAIHLAAVNIASAGPLVCAFIDWRARGEVDSTLVDASRRLARLGLFTLALGILLGFALLGILWAMDEEQYLTTLGAVPTGRWWFAAAEIGFYYLCMTPYALVSKEANRSRVWLLLPLLAATNLLYHFPPLFGVVSVAAERESFHGLDLTRDVYRQIATDPQTLSRIVHHWLAALAMAGLTLTYLGSRVEKSESQGGDARPVLLGSRIALLATVIQLPVGLWVVLQLTPASQKQVLGDDPAATALLGLSLLAASLLLQALVTVSLGDTSRGAVRRSLVWMAVILVLMSGTLHRIRQQAIGPSSQAQTRPTEPGGPRRSQCTWDRVGAAQLSSFGLGSTLPWSGCWNSPWSIVSGRTLSPQGVAMRSITAPSATR
jgi:hypothetical protein